MKQHRVAPRKPTNLMIGLVDAEGRELLSLPTANLSLTGMFVKSEPPYLIGSHVRLKFFLPGETAAILATAIITRIAAKKRGPGRHRKPEKGFGLRFVGMSMADMKRMIKYLDATS